MNKDKEKQTENQNINDSFVLLPRSIIDSDVFAVPKLLKIYLWCLARANFKPRSVPLKIGKGETVVNVKRGEFIFGRHRAEEDLNINGSTIYKSIHKLQDMGFINIESNNQYSVISICNYDIYQTPQNYKVTGKEQPSNRQVTTNEQPSNTDNNSNNDNNENNSNKEKTQKKTFSDDLLNFYNEIIKYFPENTQPKSQTDKEKWLKTLDELQSLDKCNKEDIKRIVEKARGDDFWSKNFLSLPKLRRKDKDGIKYIDKFSENFKKKINDYDPTKTFNDGRHVPKETPEQKRKKELADKVRENQTIPNTWKRVVFEWFEYLKKSPTNEEINNFYNKLLEYSNNDYGFAHYIVNFAIANKRTEIEQHEKQSYEEANARNGIEIISNQ